MAKRVRRSLPARLDCVLDDALAAGVAHSIVADGWVVDGEVLHVGAAMTAYHGAVRMSYELLGNVEPRLHVHLRGRYEEGDPAPAAQLPQDLPQRTLTREEMNDQVQGLRALLQVSPDQVRRP